MSTQKVYVPGDPNSSPFDPAMGDIVIYRTAKIGFGSGEVFPAIIVKAHADDRCDLTVFSNTGIRHIMNVKFSADPQSDNCWFWAPVKEPRKEAGETKPVDKAKKVAQTANA